VEKALTTIIRAPDRRLLLALFGVACLLRLGAAGALRAWENPQAWENGSIAQSIASGKGFSFDYRQGEISNYYTLRHPVPTSFQAPFYPYLLAGFYALGHHLGPERALLLLLILQAAVGAALVIPAYHIGRRLFDRRVGLVSAGVAAIYPAFLYAATVPHQAVWCITGFAVVFWAMLRLREQPTLGPAALAGALLGLLLLAEPVFLGILAAGFIGIVLVSQARRRTILSGGVALGVALVVISPWLVRGYRVHGRFVFMKSSSGFNLWQGNNLAANGTPHSGWIHVAYPAPPSLLRRVRQAHGELGRDDVWRQAALADMKAAPPRTARLMAEKVLFFWTITPYHRLTRNPWYWLPYALLFIPAIAVMVSLKRRLYAYLPALLPFAAATVIYSITFTGPRYRMPLEPLLFVFSAQGLLLAASSVAKRIPGLASARSEGRESA